MGVLPGIPKRIQVSSCCCFSVRTACLIFGWFGLFTAVMNLFSLSTGNFEKNLPQEYQEMASKLVPKLFMTNLMSGLMSGALLVGVLKNKPKLMYPWIYMQFIGIVILLIVEIIIPFVVVAGFISNDNNDMSVLGAVLLFIGYVIFCVAIDALVIYLVAPVVVHCRQLSEMKRNQLSQSA
ncbi:hypothetical protein HCN44_002449 [Aphidius gifuensis]|uniref:DUF7027 domain-containing protein n=1 Tax=Aphidius gifuensis TaxID=684658 RepID=A0A834Y3B8_APHGI|nr:uncharacterized protein LOC122860872 [Aphidius gifuensis]KAF7996803.1 hypothetical protein HCN44_002449 [Aphidius gifuensis]